MHIHDVLRGKPRQDVVTIAPDATVRDLIHALAEHNVGALIVSSDGRRVEGIVSERDVVRRLHEDTAVLTATIESLITTDVRPCAATTPVHDLLERKPAG